LNFYRSIYTYNYLNISFYLILHMVKAKPKITLQIPEGLLKEINEIMKIDDKWITIQDFVREAIKEKIERWKKEHPGHP
ncbi:MAG: ribbon-helix-helix domain-containing protein, partial [Minisyncoccia bacterium]